MLRLLWRTSRAGSTRKSVRMLSNVVVRYCGGKHSRLNQCTMSAAKSTSWKKATLAVQVSVGIFPKG